MAWIAVRTNQNPHFSEAQKQNNANIIAAYFRGQGWTDNAIAGLLGNMELESYINPAQSELGTPLYNTNFGFGLVQWTDASRRDFVAWAGSDWETNYNKQLYRITYEQNGGYIQWIPKPEYNYMVMAFEESYERGTPLPEVREPLARKWYNYLQGLPPGPIPGGNLPIWLLFKIRWQNKGR